MRVFKRYFGQQVVNVAQRNTNYLILSDPFGFFFSLFNLAGARAEERRFHRSGIDTSINMNIMNNTFSCAIFICFTFVLLSTVNSLPFLFGNQNANRPVVPYQSPPDDWNISSVPRSITPHLMVKYNETVNRIISGRRSDAEINNDTLKYLRAMKVCARNVHIEKICEIFEHDIFA